MGDDLRDEKERETELLTLAKTGDREAWSQLLVPIRQRLLKAVLSIVKNETEAEDLVQETLYAMYLDVKEFRGESRLYTWMWVAAQRKAINSLRDSSNRRKLLEKHTGHDAYGIGPGMGAPQPTPEKIATDRESVRQLSRAMEGNLSPDEQETLLRTIEEGEATEEAEPAPSSAAERVARHRVRKKLRQAYVMLNKKEDDQ